MLATLGPCLIEVGEEDAAVHTARRSAAAADEVGDPDLLIRAYNNLVDVVFSTGRIEDAAQIALDAKDDVGPLATMRIERRRIQRHRGPHRARSVG